MSIVSPAVVIELGQFVPLKYGLKSVAKSFPGTVDSHWRSGGVQFMSNACADANLWFEDCGSPGTKAEPPEPTLKEFDPFTAYADWLCGPLGMTPAEREAKSRMALDCAEDRQIEDFFYQNYLSGGGAIALNTEGTAVSLAAGVGMLEAAMGLAHCGEPTIHAPREIGALAARFNLTYGSGSILRTPLGSPWIFGSGYGNEAPDGGITVSGVAWLYATGPIYLIQSEVFMVPPTFADALNRTNNEVRWEASRTSLVAEDSCVLYAVAVLTSDGGGGGGDGGDSEGSLTLPDQ